MLQQLESLISTVDLVIYPQTGAFERGPHAKNSTLDQLKKEWFEWPEQRPETTRTIMTVFEQKDGTIRTSLLQLTP